VIQIAATGQPSVDDYADETELPSFASMVCSKCGGDRVDVRPNWNEMKIKPPRDAPAGKGKR